MSHRIDTDLLCIADLLGTDPDRLIVLVDRRSTSWIDDIDWRMSSRRYHRQVKNLYSSSAVGHNVVWESSGIFRCRKNNAILRNNCWRRRLNNRSSIDQHRVVSCKDPAESHRDSRTSIHFSNKQVRSSSTGWCHSADSNRTMCTDRRCSPVAR